MSERNIVEEFYVGTGYEYDVLNLHTNFKNVKKLSNEKFLDTRELDENFLTYYKI
jgi:hypothetical protein